MPLRLLTHLEVPFAALVTLVAAAAGIDDLTSVAIWDKSQLRLWCIVGSIFGAFLAVGILPSHERHGNYSRRLAIKFVASFMCGIVLTPIVIRWRQWPVDSDVVMCVAFIVAMLAVSLISAGYPHLMRWSIARAKKKLEETLPTRDN